MDTVKVSEKEAQMMMGGEPPVMGEVCYQNLGPRERRLRAWYGHAAFAGGLALAAGLLVSGASPWWRLLVYGPFAAAAANWLQARERT